MNESMTPSDNMDGSHGNGGAGSGGEADQASARPTQDRGQNTTKLQALAIGGVALLVASLGILLGLWFNWSESRAKKGEPEEKTARLVETVTVERTTDRVELREMGTVIPTREVVIRPRISGKIVRQSARFVPGGRFDEGDLMVQLDRTDYRHTVSQRESALAQAQADLEIRKGDQAVAREELQLLEGDITGGDRDLILRKPQVNQAKAAVKSARAALKQAKTDLARTRVEAPFDGHLISRSASVGSNVAQGDQLATFVGSDRYWVNVSIPVAHLRWIKLPEGPDEKGSMVRVTNETSWGDEAYREGHVSQVIGQLENGSRMAQLMVTVPDPLAQSREREDKPSLLLGAVVEVICQGVAMSDVVTIDRSYLRDGDTVWVMNESDRLESRSVEVAFADEEKAYIQSGLQDGDRVIKTNLSSPVPDMHLRTAGGSSDSAPEQGSEGNKEAGNA